MDDIKKWVSDFLNILTKGQPFGWNNVLDVLIVAVFVYYVLLLIRGTRAVQLLIGVMVLVLIYFVASYLHLTLTTLLLQALFAVALIALVVVFQPELRRALGQIGQLGPLNRLLAPGSEEELEGIVDELVRAALLISEAKHGALIVLERATGLQDYSETGVPVNGKLTAELLASIFMTRSPLHDGAVIVRGGQILAAACLLPLEENTDRGAHRYGMRHRAALSISAQTDAIVVVVSEETQAISIAAGGRIIGALDEERLRRRRLAAEAHRGPDRVDLLDRLCAERAADRGRSGLRRSRRGRAAGLGSLGLRAPGAARRRRRQASGHTRRAGERRGVGSSRDARPAPRRPPQRRPAGRSGARRCRDRRCEGREQGAGHGDRTHRADHLARGRGAGALREQSSGGNGRRRSRDHAGPGPRERRSEPGRAHRGAVRDGRIRRRGDRSRAERAAARGRRIGRDDRRAHRRPRGRSAHRAGPSDRDDPNGPRGARGAWRGRERLLDHSRDKRSD